MKLLLPVLAALLASCASKPEAEKEEPGKSPPAERTIVGRIASVSKIGQFVLIQKFGPGTLPADLIYQSRGPQDRSASLRPSGERIRDFFAADLLSGSVEKGDAVVAYSQIPEERDPADAPPADSQTKEDLPGEDGEDGGNDQDLKNIKD